MGGNSAKLVWLPSENGSNLKGNIAVKGKFFPFRVDPFLEGPLVCKKDKKEVIESCLPCKMAAYLPGVFSSIK